MAQKPYEFYSEHALHTVTVRGCDGHVIGHAWFAGTQQITSVNPSLREISLLQDAGSQRLPMEVVDAFMEHLHVVSGLQDVHVCKDETLEAYQAWQRRDSPEPWEGERWWWCRGVRVFDMQDGCYPPLNRHNLPAVVAFRDAARRDTILGERIRSTVGPDSGEIEILAWAESQWRQD